MTLLCLLVYWLPKNRSHAETARTSGNRTRTRTRTRLV